MIAEEEVSGCGIGVRLDGQNVFYMTSRTMLMPGRKWAQLVPQARPVAEDLFRGLPDKPFAMIATGAVSATWDWGGMQVLQRVKERYRMFGLTKAQAEKLPEMSPKTLEGARAASMVMGVGRNPSSIFSNVVVVTRVDDSRKFLAAYEEYLRQYSKSTDGLGNSRLPSVDVTKTTFDGDPALKVAVTMPASAIRSDYIRRAIDALLGPGGKMVSWTVAANDHAVVTAYTDEDGLWSAVDDVKRDMPGLAHDIHLLHTYGLLPRPALWMAYFCPQGIIDLAKRLRAITALWPDTNNSILQFGRYEIPAAFPQTPPIGFAITTAPNEYCAHLVVPAEVFQVIGSSIAKACASRGEAASPTWLGWTNK